MSVRHLLAVPAAAVLGMVVVATPAAAQVLAESPAVDPSTLTARRLVATVAALMALAGAVAGGLALARTAGRIGNGNVRRDATVALGTGLTGGVVGGLVVAAAEGGPGSGYGIVGGYAALVLGPIAVLLGWLALARSHRTAT
jgi:hypothetical protein